MSTPPASLSSLSTSTSTPALPLRASAQRRGGIGRPPWALALAAVFGYSIAQWADRGLGGPGESGAVDPYEALPTPSFSEVATVKLTMENLLLEHFRALHTQGSPTTPPDRHGPLRTDPQATYRLEQLIHEFAGTDQALVMTGMLLSNLKRQEDWQRWLDVYLATAYERPTSLLATSFLSRARLIARDAGREHEIDRLEQHLAEIPADLAPLPLHHPGRAVRSPTP